SRGAPGSDDLSGALAFSSPEAADRLERAAFASPGVAPRGALAADAEVAQGEVEAHRVARVQRPQPLRHFLRGLPGEIAPARRPDEAADAVDVSVERHDQRLLRHVPEAEIDAVGPSDHPAQEEVEPFAGAPASRMRQEVLEPSRRSALAEERREIGGAQLVDQIAQRLAD